MEAVEKAKEYMKGTTTVGLACKEGVVLVADRRATMGSLIAHKEVQKIFQLDDHIGMTVAGAVSDAQTLVRWIKAEAQLYKLRKGEEISVKGMATLIANVLHSQRYYPMLLQLIVGGYDSNGGGLYSVDLMGSAIEDRIISTGSGSPMAYGVLEDGYRKDLSIDECVDLAKRALRSALGRDAMTGDGMDGVKITKKGYEKIDL
ncbi:MAG: archaeal proteasome endopeptidase complex subunit beta [Methanobacteriota archaeon]|nr:MAG: archaeal proteasome endopeptidase complex subunit beta [Euryarchaeota archaeon]